MNTEVREPAVAYGKKRFTIEEYLAFEEITTEKHQYYKEEIFAMSGAKIPHNIISGNLYFRLREKLNGKSCRPFNSDQRIHIPLNTLFTYPDISIICGEPETLNNDNLNLLTQPLLLKYYLLPQKIMTEVKNSSFTGIFNRSENTYLLIHKVSILKFSGSMIQTTGSWKSIRLQMLVSSLRRLMCCLLLRICMKV